MNRQASTVVVLVLAGIGIMLALWLQAPEPETGPAASVTARQDTPLSSSGLPAPSPMSKAVSPTPLAAVESLAEALQGTSLRGTQVDRPQLATVDGQLLLNGTILFYFDYFLSLEGEMSIAEITELVRLDLYGTYPVAIAGQLFDLFRRYVSYLDEVAWREASVTREQVLAENLSASDMQAEVRRHHFRTEEIEALFGDYEKMLARPSQASQRQKQFEAYRQAIQASPAEQERIATEIFGAQAADNLRNVQYRRQQWEGRVANYLREKQLVMNAYPEDVLGQQQAIELLQQRLFTETEARRVRAIERIRQQQVASP